VASIVLLALSVVAAAGLVVAPGRIGPLLGLPVAAWGPEAPPDPPAPLLAAAPTGDAPVPSPAGVAAALRTVLADPALGTHTPVSVQDVATGAQLYDRSAAGTALPASTMKLLTAVAALTTRGPTYRITTRVVAGAAPGEVVLVGGGDPTLAAGAAGTYPEAGRLDQLAAQVKRALGGTAPTRVVVDDSLFSGPVYGPWAPDIPTGGFVGPITALMIDGTRTAPVGAHGAAPRSPQPDLAAGVAFAAALGLPASAVRRGPARTGAAVLGSVQSPPVMRLVETMLTESDNVIAECLARQVALAKGEPATFTGGAAAVLSVLRSLGLPLEGVAVVDGSGFSRSDHVSPLLLTSLLRLVVQPAHPELRPVLSGLPVSAYSGTLRERYRKPTAGAAAAGVVRAKTGTLLGVSAIAGITVDADGRMLTFAVMADGVAAGATTASQEALDRVAATIAACGCR